MIWSWRFCGAVDFLKPSNEYIVWDKTSWLTRETVQPHGAFGNSVSGHREMYVGELLDRGLVAGAIDAPLVVLNSKTTREKKLPHKSRSRKSTPPHNAQLKILISDSKQ